MPTTNQAKMFGRTPEQRQALHFDLIIGLFALVTLLITQWMLSSAIHGSNYYGTDGKMAQATVLTALRFGGLFQITNLSPIEGVGSQLLPYDVWANVAYWPFAFLDKKTATDISALVALAIYAASCYIMARCFDVPVVPSAIAGQLCLLLFAPALLLVYTPTNFCLTPANAVVYAPHLIALGLLARLEPGSWRRFALITGGIFALLLYSFLCEPMWSVVSGLAWFAAFAVVAFGPLRRDTILIRLAALGCCVALLFLTGALEYAYTLSRYTARAFFPAVGDRPHLMAHVTAATYSSNMKHYYLAWAAGWGAGLLTLRGRPRLLVAAAVLSFCFYVAYSLVFLLVNVPWTAPIPIYFEQCLIALYLAAAVVGYWGAGRAAVAALGGAWRSMRAAGVSRSPSAFRWGALAAGLIVVSIIPAAVADYAVNRAEPVAEIYDLPWANEPELVELFDDNIGLSAGQPFRGAVHFWGYDFETSYVIVTLWAQGVSTIAEYSQLVSPPAFYFLHAVLQNDVTGYLNRFIPLPGPSWDNYFKALQLFGTRYFVAGADGSVEANKRGYTLTPLPRHGTGYGSVRWEATPWQVYELPRPNVGDYSPTEVITAKSAADIAAAMRKDDFDPARDVVLSEPLTEKLVPARDMKLAHIRGGLHLSGKSDGTSLVVLPQQFSNCLRARDPRVRLVRADLMLTGVIFSGDLDTDILFDYGVFTPACRRADLADLKRLDLKIDVRMPHLESGHLFPTWNEAVDRLRAAAQAIN